MKSLIHLSLAIAGLALLSSCETTYNEDDGRRHHHGATTTTTTEETTTRRGPLVNAPISTTVETQTTRAY
ncbi:MAG: hypothetical protein IPK22_22295 [Verrucomicrobiaceae bacterium]|nr:hypothetical protein [Verrucomicrobiaceae bacterium]